MILQIGSITIVDPQLVKAVLRVAGNTAHDCSKSSFALRQAAQKLAKPSLKEKIFQVFRLDAQADQLRENRRSLRLSLRHFGRHMRIEKCTLAIC